MLIRKATTKDLQKINEIFNWHSENGISTFSKSTSILEREEWFKRFDSPKHIALVAEESNQITGVACSFAYRGGGVFKDTIETSVYLKPNNVGKGLGSKLYTELFKQIKSSGAHKALVGIALPNDSSVGLHKKFGFKEIGTFDEYAFYKGQYRSSVWMQKEL